MGMLLRRHTRPEESPSEKKDSPSKEEKSEKKTKKTKEN